LNSVTSSYSLTASYVNTLNQDVIVSGSISVTADTGETALSVSGDVLEFTGSLLITGSIALTGSMSLTGTMNGTASYSLTASYIDGGFY
jgi:hypothetical protein